MPILSSMIKEEWRMHSSIFGSSMFALFPVLLAAFSFFISLFLPLFSIIIPAGEMALLAHYMFLLLGLSVGAFGLFGREIMNRRFGHASLIAYSSRSLPVSERFLFLNFLAKDVIYYFFLWILPPVAGFGLASLFISASPGISLLLLLTSALSFLIGLSASFFLSTIYAHSRKLLISILVAAAAAGLLAANYFSIGLPEMLPPLSFFTAPSFSMLALSLLLIIIPSSLSLLFLKVDYPESKRLFRNSLDNISNSLNFISSPLLVSKDFLDLDRSEGGMGKIIFSFLFPLAIVWLLLSVLLRIMPAINPLLLFSIFLGIISSSIYNWLTEFDLASSYSFLPVRISDVIKGKIGSYAAINAISIVILSLAATGTNDFSYFLPALISFLSVSSYALSITVYLAGLYPNVLLYNAKIFLGYTFLILPVLLTMIFSALLNPFYLLFSAALLPVSYFIIKRSYAKWDNWEEPGF